MREIITRDNSITFYNEEYDETYHSVSGAVEEAFKKFVEPATDFIKGKDQISILDVGFGLGYNSAAVIDGLLELNPGCRISIVGLEKDKEILGLIPGLFCPQIKNYYIIKEAVNNMNKNMNNNMNNNMDNNMDNNMGKNYMMVYNKDKVRISLVVCDALKGIKSIRTKFDIILHDPFSPRKNPELWTESFFKELRKLIKKDGVLTTYSCARIVRDNLKKAGFKVSDGPRVGRRAPSTIAIPV